jgi:hypothetical protein
MKSSSRVSPCYFFQQLALPLLMFDSVGSEMSCLLRKGFSMNFHVKTASIAVSVKAGSAVGVDSAGLVTAPRVRHTHDARRARGSIGVE